MATIEKLVLPANDRTEALEFIDGIREQIANGMLTGVVIVALEKGASGSVLSYGFFDNRLSMLGALEYAKTNLGGM